MKKVAFNQAGFQAKKSELSKLSVQEFKFELFQMVNNTRDWVENNFILSSEQTIKLESMPKEFLREMNLASVDFCYN
ncbi:hypothetical protein [Myroides sp. LJL119]